MGTTAVTVIGGRYRFGGWQDFSPQVTAWFLCPVGGLVDAGGRMHTPGPTDRWWRMQRSQVHSLHPPLGQGIDRVEGARYVVRRVVEMRREANQIASL